MTNDRTITLAAIPIVALVGAAAFWQGPLAGLGAVGFVAVVGLIMIAPSMYRGMPVRAPAPVARAAAAPEPARSMAPLVAWAIGIRLVAALVFNLTTFADNVAPDHAAYRYYGKMIVASWSDPTLLAHVDGYNPHSFYQYANAVVYWLTGADSSMVLSLFNPFIAVGGAWLAAKLAGDLYGPVAARRTFILTAFFPSLVLWSSINLRDCWSWLALSIAVLAAQRLRQHFGAKEVVMLLLSMGIMASVRPYILLIFCLGLGLSYMITKVKQLPYAIASVALVYVALNTIGGAIGLSSDLIGDSGLQQIQDYRMGLAYGGSAYKLEGDVSTPIGALLELPIGVARFLFAPFPWQIKSWRQVLALPETLYWYFLVPFTFRGILRSMREEVTRVATPVMIALVITVSYGLVEGNEGTAYRHRAQVMPLLLMFAAGDYAARRRQGVMFTSRSGTPSSVAPATASAR